MSSFPDSEFCTKTLVKHTPVSSANDNAISIAYAKKFATMNGRELKYALQNNSLEDKTQGLKNDKS